MKKLLFLKRALVPFTKSFQDATSFLRILCFLVLLLSLNSVQAQIAQRGSATTSAVANSTLTISKPANVQIGDVLIANFVQNLTDGKSLSNASSTGWTFIQGRAVNSAGDNRWWGTLLYKVATADEPSNYTFTMDSDADMSIGTIVAFSGVDVTSAPFDVTPGTMNTGNNSSPTASAITTTTAGAAVIMFVQVADNNTFSNWSSSFSELYVDRTTLAGDGAIAAAWRIQSSSGSTGSNSVGMSASDRWAAIQIALRPKPSCPSSIVPGATLTSTSTACNGQSVTLSLQNSFAQSSIVYQWQVATVGLSNWNDVSGANSATYSFAFSGENKYRCRVSCATTQGLSIPITISAAPFTTCYCEVTANTDDQTGITEVLFNTIANTSTVNTAYTNNSAVSSTSVVIGQSYPMNVRVNTAGNYAVGTAVWFDWNQNGVFDDIERYVLGEATNVVNGLTSLSPFSITVPSDALRGETIMRVRASYGFYPAACGNQNWSEAEDYKITVVRSQSWAGTVSSDWNNALNWDGAIVPDIYTNVTIGNATYQPQITIHALVNELEVQSGSSLEINDSASITVTESITVLPEGNLFVADGASIVQVKDVQNTGNIRVQKTTRALMRLDYLIWSSPVVGSQTLKQFSPQTVDSRFYDYNGINNTWEVTNNQVPFPTAKGYLIRLPNAHPTSPTTWTGQFVGTPQNGNVTVAMPLPRNSNENRYFLVGNPYPSAIDMKKFLDGNEATITGVFYFYRKTNGAEGTASYFIKSKNPNFNPNNPTSRAFIFTNNGEGIDQDIIASGQGFFVEMKEGHSQVIFTNEMRIAVQAGILNRQAQTEVSNRYMLELTDGTAGFSQIQIGHYATSTSAYDEGYDAVALGSGGLLLGSLINEQTGTYAAQTLGDFEDSTIIPLRFKTTTAGTFTIELKEAQGIFSDNDTKILIEDLEIGLIHDFAEGAFVFNAALGDYTSRFQIRYEQNGLNIPSIDNQHNQTVIFAKNQQIHVKSSTVDVEQIIVYTLEGKIYKRYQFLNPTTAFQLPIEGVTNQIMLVQLVYTNGTTSTQKVSIN
jgi:hypothetical protein